MADIAYQDKVELHEGGVVPKAAYDQYKEREKKKRGFFSKIKWFFSEEDDRLLTEEEVNEKVRRIKSSQAENEILDQVYKVLDDGTVIKWRDIVESGEEKFTREQREKLQKESFDEFLRSNPEVALLKRSFDGLDRVNSISTPEYFRQVDEILQRDGVRIAIAKITRRMVTCYNGLGIQEKQTWEKIMSRIWMTYNVDQYSFMMPDPFVNLGDNVNPYGNYCNLGNFNLNPEVREQVLGSNIILEP